MRKIVLILFAALFFFVGCDKERKFTQKQISAFYVLAGNFQAYEQDALVAGILSFGTRYGSPKNIVDGKKSLFFAHGECSFADSKYPISEKGYFSCYYRLSESADAISFYHNGGVDNNKFIRTYSLSIEDNSHIRLEESGRRLLFERIE